MTTWALTVWQPWATLLIEGIKPWEYRGRALPQFIAGQRIVLHAAKRPVRSAELAEIMERLERGDADGMDIGRAMDLIEKVWRRSVELPLSAALGTLVLEGSRRCTDIFPHDDTVDPGKWGWRAMFPVRWEPPVTIGGAQGFWKWTGRPIEVDGVPT